ncbi:MAG: hypothetical protein U5N55_11675 [Cypionkella sp.]|nr:hypothetical protein [Cypionkella sp.]
MFKINHFDNRAKATGLKALEFAMRAGSIAESSVPFDVRVTKAQIDDELVPYNRYDVADAQLCASLPIGIDFRYRPHRSIWYRCDELERHQNR